MNELEELLKDISLNTKIQSLNYFFFFFLLNSVEIALQQNEIMNTFVDDWKSLAEEESSFGDKTDTHLKEYQSFTDLHSLTEKMITCVSWHPDIYGEMGDCGSLCDDIEIVFAFMHKIAN